MFLRLFARGVLTGRQTRGSAASLRQRPDRGSGRIGGCRDGELSTWSRACTGVSRGGPGTNAGLRFTPDGKAVAFVLADKGNENIWAQPLDGGKRRKLTNFDSRQIQDFSWSRDGKQLVVLRNEYTDDVILLRDTGRSTH